MANNGSNIDDILSMIDTGSDDSGPKKSTQQSLRDRMINESKGQQAAKPNIEEEMEQEILDEEIEEEHKSGINMKVVIIAIVAVVIILIVLITQLGKKKEPEPVEEPVEEVVVEEPVFEEQPITYTPITYTAEEVMNLHAAGATNEQIEEWQQTAIPYDYVYYSMLEQYYAFQLRNTLPTYDMSSDEFKDVISDTWMALPKRTDIVEWTNPDYLAYQYEEKQNLDYEKVEPFGNQLFLKVYLDATTHESWFFLNITPEEWNQLDDTGNVVVSYTYSTHYKPYENSFDAEEDTENIFITNATLDIIASLKNRE